MAKFKVGDIIYNNCAIIQISKLDIIEYHYQVLYIMSQGQLYNINHNSCVLSIPYIDSTYDYLSDELKLELL